METTQTQAGKSLFQSFNNVFSYAAGIQKWVNKLFEMNGHEIKWSFAHDFAIADWTTGERGVRETMKRVREAYKDNYKAWAQAVAQLSAMADAHYQLKKQGVTDREAVIGYYHRIFDDERSRFNKRFASSTTAQDYLFELYD